MKLYRVKLKGMQVGTPTAYGHPYVVADNPDKALKIVQSFVNKEDLGFSRDREMDSVTLLAEEGMYPPCGIQLFIKRRISHDRAD